MDRLLELLRTRAFARREVTLSSGQKSDWFIDCKQAVLCSEGHALVGARMFERLQEFGVLPAAVAGVALGGCSLASAVASYSFSQRKPIDAIYVRKKSKEHGSQRLIEGDDHLPERARVCVLEDVITTGSSTARAIETLRARPFDVVGVVALVDRQEAEGAERIRALGVPVLSLYRRADFMEPR
jgi:orotate phosphoribosyltransferase